MRYFIKGNYIYAIRLVQNSPSFLYAAELHYSDAKYMDLSEWNRDFTLSNIHHQSVPDSYALLINKEFIDV